MSYLNKSQEYFISKLLKKYSYDIVLEIIEDAEIEDDNLYLLLKSCQHAVNFDFRSSIKYVNDMDDSMNNRKEIKQLTSNLQSLIEGDPDNILSELIENTKIQIVNGEYIDFLGRLYRLQEALFKYIFVSTKEKKNYKIGMHGNMMSKKNILYTLKKKYNIYNGNLIHGVTHYVNKYVKQTKRMEKVMSILNSQRLENLIKLRNISPVGHGFKGVSKEEIENIYGNPMEVINDLVKVCELLDLEIVMNKYDNINEMIIQMIGKYIES